MRLVIDLQGAQSTGSRKRGIGRYSLSLARAIARNRGSHEIIIALSGLFFDTIKQIKTEFEDLLPPQNIVVWDGVGGVASSDAENDSRRQAVLAMRQNFLRSLSPDFLLITSLFEGFSDDAVVDVPRSCGFSTAVILYDLIPLIYRDIYLDREDTERWYMRGVQELQYADMLLSISASSGAEAVQCLGVDPARVVNISTAADSHFKPIDSASSASCLKKYGITREYVMYTGGIDHRKNIEGLIRAFSGLPRSVRDRYQLAVVCSAQDYDRQRLVRLADQHGLGADDYLMTGFVPEQDLVALYNACSVFVFPSWHEGFGLPALEAMQCGKAVIASNSSSLPEVIGRADALFDPRDDQSIRDKLFQVLTDEGFRRALEEHALIQSKSFGWDVSAQRALRAMEAHLLAKPQVVGGPLSSAPGPARRLAYFSPLPPERSGISDYSAELLRELTRHYVVDVVVFQDSVSDAWINANCAVRTIDWFRQHAAQYDRVLYHFGNSHFHQHMFSLIDEIPGVVVLHDFFLSGIQAHRELACGELNVWTESLLESHGYDAVRRRYARPNVTQTIYEYPANLSVIQRALGVIVHSEHSKTLARRWYGVDAAMDWETIPLLRQPPEQSDRQAARKRLGISEDDFVVCSFGMLAPTKLSERLLQAWLGSPLAMDSRARLVFVGELPEGSYAQTLRSVLEASSRAASVEITGWADQAKFRDYLMAADVGVQLRAMSRGETSAAVLDCMNYGLATIANANGSLGDLNPAAVWLLPDEFTDLELVDALTAFWRDPDLRNKWGASASAVIKHDHAPDVCAARYAVAIERFYASAEGQRCDLIKKIAELPLSNSDICALSAVIARTHPPHPRRRQFLIDVSGLVDANGVAVRGKTQSEELRLWLNQLPDDWQVELVYTSGSTQGFRYARKFALQLLGLPIDVLRDDVADFWRGDVYLGVASRLSKEVLTYLQQCHIGGTAIWFMVTDMVNSEEDSRWGDFLGFDGVVCRSTEMYLSFSEWFSSQQKYSDGHRFSPVLRTVTRPQASLTDILDVIQA